MIEYVYVLREYVKDKEDMIGIYRNLDNAQKDFPGDWQHIKYGDYELCSDLGYRYVLEKWPLD